MGQHRIEGAAELPCGEMRRVEIDGHPVCLVHAEDGRYFAVDDTCSHEEASLSEGWTYDHEIECPRHNAVFDLETGEVVSLPATDPIAVYPVAVDGVDLVVASTRAGDDLDKVS